MQAQYKKTGKSCVKVVYKTFQMPLNPSEIKGLRHIYAKTLDFTGFLNDSKAVCFQSIFSNRFILSHICPCKIGKYVGKVSGFTNGLF